MPKHAEEGSQHKVTRTEHLEWAKARAREYLNAGDAPQALASFASDMQKHPETAVHIGLVLTASLMFAGKLDSIDAVRKHIEGFN